MRHVGVTSLSQGHVDIYSYIYINVTASIPVCLFYSDLFVHLFDILLSHFLCILYLKDEIKSTVCVNAANGTQP